jgi:hypothetical protein
LLALSISGFDPKRTSPSGFSQIKVVKIAPQPYDVA